MKISLLYVKWRDGRPRFEPNGRLMELGFRGKDLRHDDGTWFTLEQAREFSIDIAAKIQATRDSGKKLKPVQGPTRTVADLLRDWLNSDHVQGRSAKTIDGYRKTVSAIKFKPRADRKKDPEPEVFASLPVNAIDAADATAFIEYLIKARGRHMGRACRAALSAAYNWGRTSTAWRLKVNPFAGLRFEKPDGRIVVYTDVELRVMVETADGMGRASIGDSLLLGVFTGQRQGDRLALTDEGHQDGRRIFRQSKTGAVVAIAEHPRLAQRLAEAKARVAAIKLERGTRPAEVIVDETTGLAYKEDTYRHVFAAVREKAAEKLPALAEKRDQDLRDTAVTWLARSGCSIPQIAAITGHDPKSIYTVLKHYLAITPELGDAAIAKLVTWMDAKGMAV